MNDSKNTTRFFLQRDRVHTALTGNAAVICMRAQSGVLAETRLAEETTRSALLAADSGDSVLRVKSQALPESVAYSAYGLHSPNDIPAQRPAFNGHLLVGDLYLLGNGYRGYNPVLMRFYSPDSLSPFAAGGLNCYAYCAGDPVNFSDPSGHMYRPRSRPPSPSSKTVLEVLETQPDWWSTDGSKEYMTSGQMENIVQGACRAQLGLNSSGPSVQIRQQPTSTLSPAQAQPMAGTSAATQATPSSAPIKKRMPRNLPWTKSAPLAPEVANAARRVIDERGVGNLDFDLSTSKKLLQVLLDARVARRNGVEAVAAAGYKIPKNKIASLQATLAGVIKSVRGK